jgi:hypothetical protein
LTDDDLQALAEAVRALERPGFAARLTGIVGKPIELIGKALPAGVSQAISGAVTQGLDAAVAVALRTMSTERRSESPALHKVAAAASGAVGGSFGLSALPFELPVSTVIMLRSIADIARHEGEDLRDPETALSCVEVFALGGRDGALDASESGYFAVRGILAKSVSEAARFIAERGIAETGAPVLVRFISQVASRFGAVVTQKVAAQAVPIVGAVGGAAVNYAFVVHFQQLARGHFTVRRLERAYGKEVVRTAYDRFRTEIDLEARSEGGRT